jgi:hypothetical protein
MEELGEELEDVQEDCKDDIVEEVEDKNTSAPAVVASEKENDDDDVVVVEAKSPIWTLARDPKEEEDDENEDKNSDECSAIFSCNEEDMDDTDDPNAPEGLEVFALRTMLGKMHMGEDDQTAIQDTAASPTVVPFCILPRDPKENDDDDDDDDSDECSAMSSCDGEDMGDTEDPNAAEELQILGLCTLFDNLCLGIDHQTTTQGTTALPAVVTPPVVIEDSVAQPACVELLNDLKECVNDKVSVSTNDDKTMSDTTFEDPVDDNTKVEQQEQGNTGLATTSLLDDLEECVSDKVSVSTNDDKTMSDTTFEDPVDNNAKVEQQDQGSSINGTMGKVSPPVVTKSNRHLSHPKHVLPKTQQRPYWKKNSLEALEKSFTELENPFLVFASNPHPAFKAKYLHEMEVDESTEPIQDLEIQVDESTEPIEDLEMVDESTVPINDNPFSDELSVRLQLQCQLDKIWSSSADPSSTHLMSFWFWRRPLKGRVPFPGRMAC